MKEILSAAADEEEEENTVADNFDFIGFTYNGLHSYTDFKIYRTSDGSRYNDNLLPTMINKTADVPGGEGQYFFNTQHKEKQFTISIAFDELDEKKYKDMRGWLDGKGIHDLVFDEHPYKVYSAKVTGMPQLKTLCFDDEDGQRMYKGEGTIQFTCYYPYAHTPTVKNGMAFDGRILDNYTDENKAQWSAASQIPARESFTIGSNFGDLPSPFVFTLQKVKNGDKLKVGSLEITIKETVNSEVIWNSKNGLITKNVDGKQVPIQYTGQSYGTIPAIGLATTDVYWFSTNNNGRCYRITPAGGGSTWVQYNDTNTAATSEQIAPEYKNAIIDYQFWYY